jgi:hypothetical protein
MDFAQRWLLMLAIATAILAICKHQYARMCLQEKCACCLITKDEKVVGHLSSPLQ